jgi:ribosome biogenesis GTPase
MKKEKAFFESSAEERRKKERQFGKIMKNYKKDMKKDKNF